MFQKLSMKQYPTIIKGETIMKKQFTILVMLCIALLGFTVPSVSAETLRILEWGFYMPESVQENIIKIAKDKYGVDLKLEIKAVNGNDDFFPALKGKTADVIAPSHNVPRDERYRLIKHKLVLPLNLDIYPIIKMLMQDYKKLIIVQKAVWYMQFL